MSNIPNYDSNNMSSELRPEHHVHDSSEPLPGAAGGRSGPDYGVGNTDTSSGFGGESRLQDRLGGFDNSAPEGGRTSLGDRRGNVDTGSGFGASDGAQPQSGFGDFETTTIGGRRGADPSADNTGIGSGFGGGGGVGGRGDAQSQDRLSGFGSGVTGGDAPDYSAATTDIGSSFSGGTQRQDGSSEFGRSGLGTSTGVDAPPKVNFGDHAKDYDSSGNDFSASAAGQPESFMATGGTTRGAQGGTGTGRREHEPAVTEPSLGSDTIGESQGRKGVSTTTEDPTPGTWETQGTQGSTGADRREHETASTKKPGVGDKIAGGTKKLVGKMMNNPDMQQKGELRESGGKSAVN